MPKIVSIELRGDKELEAAMSNLVSAGYRRELGGVLKDSAKRIHRRIKRSVDGDMVPVVTGAYKKAVKGQKIRMGKRKKGLVSVNLQQPAEKEMAILQRVLEYGRYAVRMSTRERRVALRRGTGFQFRAASGRIGARPHIRRTVDEHARKERKLMGRDIGKLVAYMWKHGAKRGPAPRSWTT